LSDSGDARSRLNSAVKACRSAFLLALVLAACAASPTAPDLERLYRTARSNPEQPPLILIPGVLGSRLEDSRGREVWPGTLWKLLSSRYPELALRIDPHTLEPVPDELRPMGLFASASGREYYSRILRVLESAGGYVPGVAGESVADGKRRYYILTYDWRQDAVKSAQALDRLIDQLRIDYGRQDLRVDVIGHSMGGLIARYYARYGTADLLNGNDEEVAGESVLRLWPGDIDNPVRGLDYQILMLEPGDGTVTKASLLNRDILDPTAPRHKYLHFSPASVFFICARHELLTANITFQDNLLQALLSVD
jgi:hypothetical protein